MTTIINYGVGNLHSVISALEYIGETCKVTSNSDDIAQAERLILPGVGAFGDAVSKLRDSGLVPAVLDYASSGKPLLGICVGMQMLFERSYEYGEYFGLSLLPGDVCPLDDELQASGFTYKVPHIGWNSLRFTGGGCPLMKYLNDSEFVYYVHSYYAKCDESVVSAISEYGVTVPGVVATGNVFGTQFHPEKSGDTGLRILRGFCEL